VTPFCFEHVFAAPSVSAVLAAYFDDTLQSEQDRCVEIVDREVLELVDTDEELRRVCRVVPRRQLPALVKPFVSGPLHYIETVVWKKRADEISIHIRPSMLRGRVQIDASYQLSRVGPNAIHRRYQGAVSVDIAVVSGRIERGIVGEFEKSLPMTAACTQTWLDRQSTPVVSARA
jgi:hypothetical protein